MKTVDEYVIELQAALISANVDDIMGQYVARKLNKVNAVRALQKRCYCTIGESLRFLKSAAQWKHYQNCLDKR